MDYRFAAHRAKQSKQWGHVSPRTCSMADTISGSPTDGRPCWRQSDC